MTKEIFDKAEKYLNKERGYRAAIFDINEACNTKIRPNIKYLSSLKWVFNEDKEFASDVIALLENKINKVLQEFNSLK